MALTIGDHLTDARAHADDADARALTPVEQQEAVRSLAAAVRALAGAIALVQQSAGGTTARQRDRVGELADGASAAAAYTAGQASDGLLALAEAVRVLAGVDDDELDGDEDE